VRRRNFHTETSITKTQAESEAGKTEQSVGFALGAHSGYIGVGLIPFSLKPEFMYNIITASHSGTQFSVKQSSQRDSSSSNHVVLSIRSLHIK
jgi:hypothetical protein